MSIRNWHPSDSMTQYGRCSDAPISAPDFASYLGAIELGSDDDANRACEPAEVSGSLDY
jgi:hypothetical protein